MKKLPPKIARLNDIDGLIQLEEMCFKADRLTAKQLRHLIASPTALVLVTKKTSAIIASAVVLFRKNSQIARLYSIAVDPRFQQHGIALTLYQLIERKILHQGCTEIRLEVRNNNRRAIKFYRKNGYDFFGEYRKFYEDGTDALRMRKVIKPHATEIS